MSGPTTPQPLFGRPYALALFIGSLVLAVASTLYAAAFGLRPADLGSSAVAAVDLALALGGAAFAIAIWRDWVVDDAALSRMAVALMTAALVASLLELAVSPERAAQVTTHACLILVAACVIVRTRIPLVLLWILGAMAWWGIAARIPDSVGFTLASWLDTWIFAAFVGAGVLLVTQTERRSMSSRHRSDEVAATIDPLTGLLNRRGFGQRADHLRRIAHRRHEGLWCAFVDIDHFKQVNDLWGHDTGDSVLTTVAAAVTAAARESDITGRWGGDEFVILGIGDHPDEYELELRILAGIDAGDVLLTARWTPGVTVGVSASGADVGESMALVSDADHRMYERRALRRT